MREGGDVDRWAATSRATAEVNEEDRLVFKGGWVWIMVNHLAINQALRMNQSLPHEEIHSMIKCVMCG
jgi:hypothetical protein